MSNSDKLLQAPTISYICMTFFITRSGDFVGAPPRGRSPRDTRGAGARSYQSLRFQTYAHPEFKFYDDLFYKIDDCGRRKKRVPENIHELLTERGLAYWFMDDGDSYTKTRSHLRYYRFNTQSFLLSDQERLVEALRDNFGIHASIQKHYSYYTLYIRSSSTERFVNLIRPYIHPCFDYKIQNGGYSMLGSKP